MNVPLQLATHIYAPKVEVPRRRGPKHGVAGAGLHVHVLLMAELHTAPHFFLVFAYSFPQNIANKTSVHHMFRFFDLRHLYHNPI